MAEYRYKTVAAPRRAKKTRGVRGADALLAHAMGELLSREAADGWEYVRTDSLPVEEGGGFFSRSRTVWRAVIVFRQALAAPQRDAFQQEAPEQAAPRRQAPKATPEFEFRAPSEAREPFMNVAKSSPAAPGYQAPPIGGAER